MAKKDPEASQMAAEQRRIELKKLMTEIKGRLLKVPPRVVDGSHNYAVAFKAAALKAASLVQSARPTLEKARQVANELEHFYDK